MDRGMQVQDFVQVFDTTTGGPIAPLDQFDAYNTSRQNRRAHVRRGLCQGGGSGVQTTQTLTQIHPKDGGVSMRHVTKCTGSAH